MQTLAKNFSYARYAEKLFTQIYRDPDGTNEFAFWSRVEGRG